MRSWWPWLWGVLGLALIVRAAPRDRGVITDHLEFGRRLFLREDLYGPFLEGEPLHPPYPPSFGLLTAPFSLCQEWFGEVFARAAWATLQVGALFVIGLFLRDVLRRLWPRLLPRLHLLLFVTALVTLRYILRDTHGGGGNLVNLALVLGAVLLARRRTREVLAGIVLGFSLATKPLFVLVVPLLWVFGQRRAAASAVVATAAFMALALVIHGHGMDPFLRWFDGCVQYATMTNVFAEPAYGFLRFTWMNQCLRCAVARYFGEVPAELAADVPGFLQGLGLSHVVTAWINRFLGLSLLAITGLVVWRHRADDSHRPHRLAAVLCLSLLLSPITWKAYHVALIPALFLIAVHGLGARRRWPWIFLGIYVLVCGMGEELVGKDLKEWQQSLYLQTAADLVVLATMLRCSLDLKARPISPT